MLLRASGQQENKEYDLRSVTMSDITAGVADEAHLRALTETTIKGDWLGLAAIREKTEEAIGLQQTIDVLVVAAAFNGITRVADATGIPLDENTKQTTSELRETTGIQRYEYGEKTQRYG